MMRKCPTRSYERERVDESEHVHPLTLVATSENGRQFS